MKLQKPFEKLHEITKTVFEQIKTLSKEELETHYSELLNYSGSVIENLAALRKFVNSKR